MEIRPIFQFKRRLRRSWQKRFGSPRIGLTLGGGGARGLAHIAMLEVFDEFEIKPTVISGSSMGALIGALYASGWSGRELRQLLDRFDLWQIGSMLDISWTSLAFLVKKRGIALFLEQHLRTRDFVDLRIPLYVTATDYWNRRSVVFSAGDLLEAVQASIALPGIIEPVVHDGRVLIDGGASNPLPFNLIYDQCDFLVAVDVAGSKESEDPGKMPGMIDSLLHTYQIMQASIIEAQGKSSRLDLLLAPPLTGVKVLEFYKHEEIFASLEPERERLRRFLQRFA